MSLYVNTKPMKVGEEVLYPGDRLPDEAAQWRNLRSLLNTNRVVWSPDSQDEKHPFVVARRPSATEETEAEDQDSKPFDPGDHNVDEIVAYAEEHPEQVEDILNAELEGKDRVTLVSQLRDLLSAQDDPADIAKEPESTEEAEEDEEAEDTEG